VSSDRMINELKNLEEKGYKKFEMLFQSLCGGSKENNRTSILIHLQDEI
jgi:hypothetical protein